MKLEATIGKRKGNISFTDVKEMNGYLKRKGARIKKNHPFDSFKEYSITNVYTCTENEFPKTIEIEISNLQDPQEFYQELSKQEFTLVDSKLKSDYKLKQKNDN